MTSFCTQTIHILFSDIILLFPINMAQNYNDKSLGHLARKLARVTNQHMMTSFCTLTIRTLFWDIFLLFTINMVKKRSEQMYMTLNTKTCQN